VFRCEIEGWGFKVRGLGFGGNRVALLFDLQAHHLRGREIVCESKIEVERECERQRERERERERG